jgi:hypothetical protein
MKELKVLSVLLMTCLISWSASGQKKCTVMVPNLQGTYEGKCEKGLAHGEGIAVGEDTYTGLFKKGYPHGKGTCYYAGGSCYTGDWKKGMRHGRGEYTFQINGRDTISAGKWKNDEYVGPIKVRPYVVSLVRGVDRYTIRRVKDGNRVFIKIMQSGQVNTGIQNFRIFGDSGAQVLNFDVYGYENIEFFPFECKVNYITFNKLRTGRYDVIFNFVINEPGDWEIILHN